MNPAGSALIRNRASKEIQDHSLSFYVPQFMEAPKECWKSESLGAGAKAEVPIYALFKDSIFPVTEATKVSGELRLSYSYLGKRVDEKVAITVTVNNRNVSCTAPVMLPAICLQKAARRLRPANNSARG